MAVMEAIFDIPASEPLMLRQYWRCDQPKGKPRWRSHPLRCPECAEYRCVLFILHLGSLSPAPVQAILDLIYFPTKPHVRPFHPAHGIVFRRHGQRHHHSHPTDNLCQRTQYQLQPFPELTIFLAGGQRSPNRRKITCRRSARNLTA